MEQWDLNALKQFDQTAAQEMDHFLSSVDNQAYIQAAELILQAQRAGNRVHITGIGKPGHVSAYGASLLSSTGITSSYTSGSSASGIKPAPMP